MDNAMAYEEILRSYCGSMEPKSTYRRTVDTKRALVKRRSNGFHMEQKKER
jgi:hypothetical protein